MSSSGPCPTDKSLRKDISQKSFIEAMGHLRRIAEPSSEGYEAERSLQRAMNLGDQISARTDEMEDLCQKIVHGVCVRLEDSLEAKLHAALAFYLPQIRKVKEHEAKDRGVVVDQSPAKPTQAHKVDGQPANQKTANFLNRQIQHNSSDEQTQEADTSHAAQTGSKLLKTSLTRKADHLVQGHVYANLNIVQEGSQKRNWLQLYEGECDDTLFDLAYYRKVNEKSGPQAILHFIGYGNLFGGDECPEGVLATIANSTVFRGVGWCAVMLNTVFVAYELETEVQKVLEDSTRSHQPYWMEYTDLGFSVFFALEVGFRIIAFRAWFFTAPSMWRWNAFDLFLVVVSMSSAADVVFLRTLKVTRSLRQLRSLKSLRMLRIMFGLGALAELRRLLNAVEACMLPLLWSILCLALVIYFFSIFIIAGIVGNFEHIQSDALLLQELQGRFGGLSKCFRALLNVIAGPDWGEYYDLLSQVSWFEGAVIPVFLIFVQIGVLNIVIGVFAEAASGSCVQPDLVAQDQMSEVEGFVEDMISLYKSFLPDGQRLLDWEEFRKYFNKEDVQAYLAAHGVDPSHAQVLFHACDKDNSGAVDMHMFVLGLLRLKGMAKSLDAKITIHSLSTLESELSILRQQYAQLSDQFQQEHSADVQF